MSRSKAYQDKYYPKYKRLMNSRPWLKTYYQLRNRCIVKSHPHYSRYGGRGILCLITPIQVWALWVRDKAYTMKKPSIDRINNDGHYEQSNCRYIEMSENIGNGNRARVKCHRVKSG